MKLRPCLCFIACASLCLHVLGGTALGCAACDAAGKLARESENKAFYLLRILYESKGKEALPFIRRALRMKENAAAQMRAAAYVSELRDTESIPYLEGVLAELTKRVSFSNFGIETIEFRKRWIVAYTLGTLEAPGIAGRIWERYEGFTLAKKREIPYILNALCDPDLTEHLTGILERAEDHQLMYMTLDAMATGADADAIPYLQAKIGEWETRGQGRSADIGAGEIDFFVLSRKAAQVLPAIEERIRLGKSQFESREYPIKEEAANVAYF